MLYTDINVKTLPLPRTVGLVCVCVGGGNQGVIIIQTSTMTPLLATVSRKCWRLGWAVVANAFHSKTCKMVHVCA